MTKKQKRSSRLMMQNRIKKRMSIVGGKFLWFSDGTKILRVENKGVKNGTSNNE